MPDSTPPPLKELAARLRRAGWIFFDVGYTLFDETGGWQDQFERLSADVTAEGRPASVESLWALYRNACVTFAPGQWRAVVEACAPAKSDVDRLVALSNGWRHDLERPYPGVVEAVVALSKRYKLGVVANQARGTRERLEAFGLLGYFDVVASSAEAGVSKPDPAIFQLALREANCTAADAIMVGDRLDNDIAPANRLGMLSVHVRQGGSGDQRPRSSDEMPTLSVATVPEFAALMVD